MSAPEALLTFADPEADLGGLTQAEVMGRGRAYQTFEDSLVSLTEARVRKTGVLEKLGHWRQEDAGTFALGGRPSLISDLAILTGLLLLAKEGSAMHITALTALFQYRLSDTSRELLGLEASGAGYLGHTGQQWRWYNNTHRAFHRITDLMDPFPQERYESKTYADIQQILKTHDRRLEEKRKARLDEFTKLFLVMTYKEQPRDIRRVSNTVDISFDQTYVGTPTTKGYSRKNLAHDVAKEAKVEDKRTLPPGPVDAFAGWHIRTGTRTDSPKGTPDLTTPTGPKAAIIYRWGWEANIAVRVDSDAPGQHRFPALVMAATLSLPNVAVSEEAVSLMRSSKAAGLEAGVGDADKQYWANALPARLHDPAIAEGFTPSTDYRVDRLGVQGGDHGALYIEGDAYCPATPADLQDATKEIHSGIIDIATYRTRIKDRKAYQLHQKEKPDAKGRVVLTCPAVGPSPTVTCPLRDFAVARAKKEFVNIDEANLPEFVGKICRQGSVSFNTADIRRQKQKFQYGTPEWEEFHTHARNSIESLNSQIKAGGAEDIESASRRRVRGLAAAQVIATILLTTFNIRKIAAFISDKIKADATQHHGPASAKVKVRRRDREFHNPYTGTYPPGVTPPGKPEREPVDDETGGPPLRD
jgi:hypothetical protein